MSEFALILLEKVCEAIYFALFLLIGKNIKEKRIAFIAVMIFEYLALKYFIKYNVLFQLSYTFMSFVNLKVFYKEKSQITDIFLFMFASLILIIISIATGLFLFKFPELYIFMLITNRIIMFLILFAIRKKLYDWYKTMFKHWNRSKEKRKIKSLTLRNISVIIFNLMFYILNFFMLLEIAFIRGR